MQLFVNVTSFDSINTFLACKYCKEVKIINLEKVINERILCDKCNNDAFRIVDRIGLTYKNAKDEDTFHNAIDIEMDINDDEMEELLWKNLDRCADFGHCNMLDKRCLSGDKKSCINSNKDFFFKCKKFTEED